MLANLDDADGEPPDIGDSGGNDAAAPGAEDPLGAADRQGLESRVWLLWTLSGLALAALLGGGTLVARVVTNAVPRWGPPAVAGVVAGLTALHSVARYRRWGFVLREEALYLERGVFTRVRTVVPLVRLQHTDTRRGPAERLLGLSSVVVYTAGSRGADVTIPGLTPERARDLQERLKRLAARSEADDAV